MLRSSFTRRAAVAATFVVAGAVAVACARADEGTDLDSAAIAMPPVASTVVGTPGVAPTDSLSTLADRGRIQGRDAAPVWMVVVSDFQCPYCRMWHEDSYATLKREYVDTGKIRMAYVNFPLQNHKHARPAAEAAMCSAIQGKFWETQDRIFRAQERWTPMANAVALFDSLAVSTGLDAAQYRSCISSGATRTLIQADLDRSLQAGINSTPTFLIGGEAVSGALPVAEFRKLLDAALAKAAAAPPGR